MSNAKFKVSDKVKYTGKYTDEELNHEAVYFVLDSLNDRKYLIEHIEKGSRFTANRDKLEHVKEQELEKVPEIEKGDGMFKIGDKVRVKEEFRVCCKEHLLKEDWYFKGHADSGIPSIPLILISNDKINIKCEMVKVPQHFFEKVPETKRELQLYDVVHHEEENFTGFICSETYGINKDAVTVQGINKYHSTRFYLKDLKFIDTDEARAVSAFLRKINGVEES